MKKLIFLIGIICLSLWTCKPEPDIVLDQPFTITINKNDLGFFTKGIIVSNNRGGILFEKVFTQGDRGNELVIDILIDKSHVVNVTFVSDLLGSFSNQTYFNVQSGAEFITSQNSGSLLKPHQITINNLPNNDIQFQPGNGILKTSPVRNNDLSVDILYPEDEEFIMFLWEFDGSQHYYLKLDSPDSLINVDFNDFSSFVSTATIELNEDASFFTNRSKVTGFRTGNLKNIPILAKIPLTGEGIELFEIPGLESETFRLNLIAGDFNYQKNVDDLPAKISFTCDGTGRDFGSNPALDADLFQDVQFSEKANYFKETRFFTTSSQFGNSWTVEGIYEQGYVIRLPDFSLKMKQAVPSLDDFQINVFNSGKLYQIENWKPDEVKKTPVLNENWFYEKGAFSCMF